MHNTFNMFKFRTLLLVLLPLFAMNTACQNQSYALKGNIPGAGNLQVTLEQAHFDRSSMAIGKAACDGDGNFKIASEKPWAEGLYRLSIGAKRLYFMLDGKEKTIEIKGDLANIDRMEMEVKGSETFKCYADVISGLIKNPALDPNAVKEFPKKGCTPLMQAFLATQILGNNAGGFIDEFKSYRQLLNDKMPGSKYATDFANMVNQVEAQVAQQQAGELIKVGQDAPDISLPGPDGKVRSLSSLKGKVVLLDFWASWCGPCRRENPHVVEVYKKYNSKGFEIFSVSLDGVDPRRSNDPAQSKQMEQDGKRKWMDAIKQDGLIWDNHVSDLKYWSSAPAQVYGVSSIPRTFLIGRDGKIIAVNPRQNLEQELLKVL